MPRYTRCPYYIDDSRKTISCEDVCRSFDSMDEKWQWMDVYCDTWDWMRCPYAVDMTEAYRRAEEGDQMAIENQEKNAARNEIRSLSTKLGMATKKIERLEKKLSEQMELVKSYQRRNEELYRKWRTADDKQRGEDDRIWSELTSLTAIYEQRMCYLIETYAGGKFYDSEAEAWAGDRAFTLIHDADDDGRFWKVVYEEETDNGQQDKDLPDEEQK